MLLFDVFIVNILTIDSENILWSLHLHSTVYFEFYPCSFKFSMFLFETVSYYPCSACYSLMILYSQLYIWWLSYSCFGCCLSIWYIPLLINSSHILCTFLLSFTSFKCRSFSILRKVFVYSNVSYVNTPSFRQWIWCVFWFRSCNVSFSILRLHMSWTYFSKTCSCIK